MYPYIHVNFMVSMRNDSRRSFVSTCEGLFKREQLVYISLANKTLAHRPSFPSTNESGLIVGLDDRRHRIVCTQFCIHMFF